MASKAFYEAVTLAIQAWLKQHSSIVELILVEVADEVAPLIASRVLEHLEGVLLDNTKDQALQGLVDACYRAEQSLARFAGGTHDEDVDNAEADLSALRQALVTAKPFAIPLGIVEDLAGDVDHLNGQAEGGAE